MKKLVSTALALALCLSLSVPAFAANYESYTVTTEDATLTFDAASVTKETIKLQGMEGDPYEEQVTMITLKPGSTVTVVDAPWGVCPLVSGFELMDNGAYDMSPVYYEFTTGSVDSVFEGQDGVNYNLILPLGDNTYVRLGADAGQSVANSGFNDVVAGSYYADAVKWAVDKGVTAGTSATTFSPNNTCTTAQILTFLWRANGSPAPAGNNAAVPAGQYYTDAANWALEKGPTDAFSADTPATRAATVTYLWKLAGKPAADTAAFTDVDAGAEYAQAVAWAVKEGITSGTSATTFAPDNTCTRGQIVTFLYRDLA